MTEGKIITNDNIIWSGRYVRSPGIYQEGFKTFGQIGSQVIVKQYWIIYLTKVTKIS